MKIIKLKDKSDKIQATVKEALEDALKSDFEASGAIIILINDNLEIPYEYHQSGMLCRDMLWHIKQFEMALLEGRLDEKEER